MYIELRCPEDLDVLKQLQRQERNAKQRDRYRAVLLALGGKTASEIAAKLDRSRRFVQQWTYRYRDGGLANLAVQPRSGAPTKLRREYESAFLGSHRGCAEWRRGERSRVQGHGER